MRYLVVTTYPPTRCGIGAYASQSVEKIRNEGHFVDIMSPDNHGEVDFKCCLHGGFKLLRVLKLGLFYDKIIIQYHPVFFFKSYENFRNKIANFATHISFIILFLIIRKIDIVCHEIYHYPARHTGLVNYLAHKIMWFMAPRIIFHTQKEIESFKKHIPSIFSSKKIILQKHNKDYHKYRDVPIEEARNELGIPLDIKIFLCIGFIQPHKGFDRAIKAFNAANPTNSKLYIVGSLRLVYNETLNYIRLLRYLASQNPNVVLVEQFVSDQQFDTWISACDYVVVPYREIWSSAVVGRAKLFGKEVIAADTGGLSDQIDGQDLLFTNDVELEVLIRILSEPTICTNADVPPLIAQENDQNTFAEYLSGLIDTEGAFPLADFVASEETSYMVDGLLEKVKTEIAPTGENNLLYFDTAREQYRFTLQLILDQSKGRVLDLGCSPGHVAMALTKAGFEVFGVDLSTEYLKKYPSQEWIERLQIRQVNFEQEPLPYPEGYFDYVIFTEVLEHIAITDPLQILLEIKRLLKPGGRMVLSTPNVANISNLLALMNGDNVFWAPEIFYGSLDRHNREYTPREVVTLLQKAQFSHYNLAYINTPSNWNSRTAEMVYALSSKWQTLPDLLTKPFFKNTIFVKATR